MSGIIALGAADGDDTIPIRMLELTVRTFLTVQQKVCPL